LSSSVGIDDQVNCARDIDVSGGYDTIAIVITVGIIAIIAIVIGSIYGLKKKLST
jgi:hypothetical protein